MLIHTAQPYRFIERLLDKRAWRQRWQRALAASKAPLPSIQLRFRHDWEEEERGHRDITGLVWKPREKPAGPPLRPSRY